MSFINDKEFLSAEHSAGKQNTDINTDYERDCEETCEVMEAIIEETGGELLSPERIARIMNTVRRMSEDSFTFVREPLAEIETDIPFDLVMAEEVDFDLPEVG
ncbi:MAG: hypothetical protein E7660_04520 [Ruminococcaceae bacterium]|nr:hypothetical protein [Oscillospiraceae bacterium]